jgi:Sec-independent protein translocase protein TatA
MMLGNTMRDLGSTIKEVKATMGQQRQSDMAEDNYEDEFDGSQ